MLLMAYCNGFQGVKGEYLSIYVRVCSGKYDAELNWPLHCKVDIELRSAHKSKQNVKKSIVVRAQSPIPGEKFHSQTHGFCSRFIRLDESYEHISSDGCLTIDVFEVNFVL